MHIKVRQVKCACTRGHHFKYEREIFGRESPITFDKYIQVCIKCGAYEKRKIGAGIVQPVRIYKGPDPRIYDYWKELEQ